MRYSGHGHTTRQKFIEMAAAAICWSVLTGCGGGAGNQPVAAMQATPTVKAVKSIIPENGETTVSSSAKITVTFSTDMDASTINDKTFQITGPQGAVAGSASYDAATKTATFTPLIPLSVQTNYTATLSTAVKTQQGVVLAAPVQSVFTTSQIRDLSVKTPTSLRIKAEAKGILYGAAVLRSSLYNDPALASSFAAECDILTPEGALKWDGLRPTPDTFDFEQADWLLDFAKKHNMKFRGHTLVWHEALPKWFAGTVTAQNAEQILREHIATVVGHYAGSVHSWDVVNEAVAPEEKAPAGLRASSPWYKLLGPRYISLAFHAAAAADPAALLVLSEYGLDYDTPEADAKRTAVLNLLKDLTSTGAPVHALGIHAHLDAGERRFAPEKFKKFLKEVADLGLKIMITEMDVKDKTLPADVATRDQMVAGVYSDYLSVALNEPAVIAVMTWGLSDKYTWLSSYANRLDGQQVRPLPLSSTMERKPAWNAVAKALEETTSRHGH